MNILSTKNERGPSPRVIVTTSWDDDAASGMRVAELLSARKMRGTFYVPSGELNRGSHFSVGDLRTLSANGFEVGAHTISHPVLSELDETKLVEEVGGCKSMLEQLLGREVVMFCYPRGRFNADVVRAVRRAGYSGARTTRMLCSDLEFSRYEMPTTLQAFPHTRSNYLRNVARLGGVSALAQSLGEMVWFESWVQLGKKFFDHVLRDGGVWHLYGHPWELEKLNLWTQLEQVLDYVSERAGVMYLTNAQLLQTGKSANEVADVQLSEEHQIGVAH